MNFIDKLKNGIVSGDWGLICQAYYEISGEQLSPPEFTVPKFSKESIVQTINTLFDCYNNYHGSITPDIPNIPDKKTKTKKTNKLNVKLNTVDELSKQSVYGNTSKPITSDDLGEKLPNQQEVEENKKKAESSVKQRRTPPKKYQINCSNCNQQFESLIQLGELGQQCAKCIKSARKQIDPGE